MPDAAYRVAREVARSVAADLGLSPPFDVERVAAKFATVLDEEIPTRADVVVVHAQAAGDLPRIVVDEGLHGSPERRRFAIAHGLGHVLLGWHPLGTPCDVSIRPWELPVTVHDLVEGEASAFARELLMPARWIAAFDALEQPALLARHVAERAGQALMPAARSVALLLQPGHVWCVTDQWQRVVDAGRSPGTATCAPRPGDELDAAALARHAAERHRSELDGMVLMIWRFDASGAAHLPRDRSARTVAGDIAADLGLGDEGAQVLAARVEGIAGWANEQVGTASLEGMRRVLDERARSVPELAQAAGHPEYDALLDAKATELVARRLAR
jgi:hypothetical protein